MCLGCQDVYKRQGGDAAPHGLFEKCQPDCGGQAAGGLPVGAGADHVPGGQTGKGERPD